MRRADRLFQLVQFLRARRFATAQQMADELGVSKRTVYRDIRDLEHSGVPIEGEAGVGYRLRRGYELPPLTFNAEEIEALVLGMRVVETWGDPDLATAARSVLTKVDAVLPEPLRDLLGRTALFVPGGAWSGRVVSGLAPLRRAIHDRQKVHFAYTNARGEDSERTVRPLALYFWGTRWSLAAWCELRVAYRNFRPDRMRDLRVLPDDFDGSDGIHLQGFLDDMRRTDDGPSVLTGTPDPE